MKLAHVDFTTVFDLAPDIVNVFVIEDERQFYNYCTQISESIDGNEGQFCLSDGDKTLKMSKNSLLITDCLTCEGEQKRIINKLYADLQSIAQESLLKELAAVNEALCALLDKLNAQCDCQIDYDEQFSEINIFKSVGVKLFDSYQGALERIVGLIKPAAKYLGVKNFFFVNLKCFLSEGELCRLYHEARLNEVNLFLLENTVKQKIDGEKILVLDRQLCEILV